MKIQNKLLITVLCMLLCLSACGCQGEGASGATSIDSAGDSVISPDTPSDAAGNMSQNAETVSFIGELGETYSDIPKTDNDTYRFDGWTYLALSDGTSLNSIDNADRYNADEYSFSDFSDEFPDFYKAQVNDSVGGLTMTDAYIEFIYNESICNDGKAYIGSIAAEFSGQMNLEGYIYVAPEIEDYSEKGDISFLVCDGEWADLPYVEYDSSSWVSDDWKFVWRAKAPILKLGNIDNYGSELDFIPTDGTFVRANVTIGDLSITSNKNEFSVYSAKIIEADQI